ncbi:MAG TPA: TonB-dependent receptor, partial [Telluria sp.]|nr:TonB-dependent receptor [Telluria sp.]
MKLKKLAHLIALIGVVGPAVAQQAQPQQPIQRVEITGSSIKRIAKEGALPVQVITFEDLQKQGINNAEELMQMMASNGTGANNSTSNNNVFGGDADRFAGGAAFASLRGLGANSTLVLLNGRRVATYGRSGNAVDLNSIPMAAISRIEILKDGASAIYGTDAVGGVINFILKTDYQGVEVAATATATQAGGGATERVSLLAGKGDLNADGFNVMVTASVTKNKELDSHQRAFANGFQPSRGLSPDTTGAPAANQLTGAGSALSGKVPLLGTNGKPDNSFMLPGDPTHYLQAGLLSLQGKCDSVPGMSQYQSALWPDVTSPLRTKNSCAYDYGADYVMRSPMEQDNVLGRASLKLGPDHKLFIEAMGSRSDVTSILTPAQISASLASGNAYPVGGAYYQDLSAYIPNYDNTKPILYKWRANPLGNRTQNNTTDAARVLVGLEGTIQNWDYKLGLSKAQSKTVTSLVDGYANTTAFYKVLGSGVVNVFSADPQTQQAMDAINATKVYGNFQHGKTELTQFDGNVSGEVFQLPAGAVSMAAGFDLRRESYVFDQDLDATQILLAPGIGGLSKASRDVKAVYAEMIAPITKDLELQLAVRRDDYSLIGATTNPKVAFRYQPASWLLFRGSANKGFIAPSFTQLYTGSLDQQLASGVVDTVGCARHPGDNAFCAPEKLNYKSGGNLNLRPETSKQGTVGFVVEPIKGFSASLDYWAINMKDRILNRSPLIVLANPVALSSNIVRNSDDTINYVQAGWINASGAKARGADLGLRGNGSFDGYKVTATLDGTWTQSYKFAEIEGQPYKEYVGQFFTRDLFLRWKHNATLNVARGDWSVMLSNNFSSGYKDQLPNHGIGLPPAGFNPDVASYTTFGLSSTYTGFR